MVIMEFWNGYIYFSINEMCLISIATRNSVRSLTCSVHVQRDFCQVRARTHGVSRNQPSAPGNSFASCAHDVLSG